MKLPASLRWQDWFPNVRRFDARDLARRTYWLLTKAREKMIRLGPSQPLRGRVLLSYIIESFLIGRERRLPVSHPHYWECWRMAQTWLEEGFAVDVIRWTNTHFTPQERYDVFVDVRINMERLAPLLPESCFKVMHIETAHPSAHNAAQMRRLQYLKERKGLELKPFKLIEENRAIEFANAATSVGGPFCNDSYRFAGKPIYRTPISVPTTYPFPVDKDFDRVRRRFLWFGSEGFVHKGLDLVLDAFAGLPEFELWVAGPLSREPEFVSAFRKELYETPNIRALGWLDISRSQFLEVASQCLALIYPSCSEGCASGAVLCMHAGLIPMVSYETGVEIGPEEGVLLTDVRVECLREQIRRLADRPAAELRAMAEAAWRFARQRHTRAAFAEAYRKAVTEFIAGL